MIYETRRAHSARLRNDSSRPKTRFHALPPHGIEHSMYPPLEGMNVLITGSARGIGLATARNLASLKAKVILADLSSVADAEGHIKDHVAGADIIRAPKLDLGSVSSVHSFADWMAKEARPLHLLINNAGANFMGVDPWYEPNHGMAGLPMVNFVGPMTLTRRLMPQLTAASTLNRRSRVVNVCSIMHRYTRLPEDPEFFLNDWWTGGSYRNCKLALTQATSILQSRHGIDGVDAVSVDPGAVYSNIWATSKILGRPPMSLILSRLFSTPDDACASTVHASALPSPSTSGQDSSDHQREVLNPGGYYARGLFANGLLCRGLVPEPLAGVLSISDWPIRSISSGLLASKVKAVPVAPHALNLQSTENIFRYLEEKVWK